ncbi:MAG: hypothetical protein HOV71_14090 [Hamadaea sp.]|uniref:hypothetical protein n=1 Tax=Hamadaea sp. NPDC050747 TaxID=3155789 RepID=UPI0017FBF896|nr:hypothetical protein [Hamadaea sp.]NUR49259.1 hypothetical protein [Hamadaea sp.]NUR71840.1 hypothetical protein [Hamadaea sp.]NUT07388.1 hypothetical protein [Hamadaea sp.]
MSYELPLAVGGLAKTVAMPPAGDGWTHRVVAGVQALREELLAHVRDTEGPGGAYAKVLRDAPRLAPGVQALVEDHRAILAALDASPPTEPMDVDRLRAWARHLVEDVSSHRQRGANLLYEAYCTDLGEPG